MSSFILINFSRARGGSGLVGHSRFGLVGHSRFGLVARFGLVWRGFPLLCWLVLVLSNVICSARSVSAARRSASAFSVSSVNTRNEQKSMVSRSKGSGGGATVVPLSMISQLSSATTAAFDLDDYEKEEDNEHTTTVVQTTVSVSSDQRHSKQGTYLFLYYVLFFFLFAVLSQSVVSVVSIFFTIIYSRRLGKDA